MEINKVNFDTVKTDEITKSFEDLDVNGDGKITEADKTATTNTDIANQINTLLENSKDIEPELVVPDAPAAGSTAGSSTPSTGITTVTTVDEANAKIKTLQSEISTLQTQLTTLKAESDALKAEKEKLEKEKADLEATKKTKEEEKTKLEEEKAALEKEKEAAEADVKEKTQALEDEQIVLNLRIQEYDSVKDEIARLNQEIIIEQNREAKEYELNLEKMTQKAIDNYDPEKDGDDFDAYFAKIMEEDGYPAFSCLVAMNDKASRLSDTAKNLMQDIMTQTKNVYLAKANLKTAQATLDAVNVKLTDVDTKITAKTDEIKALDTQISDKTKAITDKDAEITKKDGEVDEVQASIDSKNAEITDLNKKIDELKAADPSVADGNLSAAELLALISDAEKQLIKDNNVDLTNCVIAKGNDNQWHVYMKDKTNKYTSVARKYGKKGSLRGSDIVPKGSGYMNNTKASDSDKAKPVYTLSNVNEDLTDGEVESQYCTYSLSSPLSFDVDGDGIKTETDLVDFDIDGDGVLDKVNNSSEWVLAFDKDHDGKAGEDGSELFGDNTDLDGDGVKDGYKDGFEALKALAKKEGLISDNDNVLNSEDIQKLSDKYGLVMTNGYNGEAKSLADLGITEINLAQTNDTKLTHDFDGQGNAIMTQEGATFVVNGEEHSYADIWNAKKNAAADAFAGDVKIPSLETPKEEKAAFITTDENETFELKLNKDGVMAVKGKVNFDKIKQEAIENAKDAKKLLEDVVELEDEE